MRRRTRVQLAAAMVLAAGSVGVATPGVAQAHGDRHSHGDRPYRADRSVKIDVMGEWAHPDDDTSIIGPCGVWHQRYGTKCGVIQVTRGEGGGNAVGQENGQALGLRRENEDRVAHYRSGTVDMFYLDRVDFFYNQSAPLTQQIWDHDETLRRITRIIRTTQPDVYVGWTPTLHAGHGNHQQAGRYIWEGMKAAADPTMFPDQLEGRHALSTWQVKKVFSGGSTDGGGGDPSHANCTTGFVPTPDENLDTVAGVWTGYDSPYRWPAGNVQGKAAGSHKIWQQVNDEGRLAYPTQSREMYKGTSQPGCPRFAMTDSFVPFQPNTRPDGSANPAAGRDDAVLLGASRPDPGGFPLGTTEYLTVSRFYNTPGVAFEATVHVRSGSGTLRHARAALDVPDGWTVNGPRRIGRISDRHESTATFTVTPSESAPTGANAKIAAVVTAGHRSGYTDDVVRVVPPTEGRFHRWGKWREYDKWLEQTAPDARRLGRSDAVASIGVGETRKIGVDVHNYSDVAQSGRVSLDLPDGFTAQAGSVPYGPVAAGEGTSVELTVTNTDERLPAEQEVEIPITTTSSAPEGSSREVLQMSVVPGTTIPGAAQAPTVDGQAGADEYTGATLDLGRIWQGASRCTGAADCGVSDGSGGSYAKVTRYGDALYFFTHVVDDQQSYAVTPKECTAHWLADSVEIMVDPRGTASKTTQDTGSAFKLGVFPFTDDPSNTNGNGANGPCWERDADNHQGYSTGPLADTVADAPNAPGVEVASSATWVGTNETTTDHAYAGGGYDLEVKVPMADLPAAVDPQHMRFNITPYDNDDTSAEGTTTLRHIDNSTRLGWSAFGSVQSDPYRWGHATVDGYTPPSGRSTTPPPPTLSSSNLNGADSPQTIHQSARDGVPIAGREPVPAHSRLKVKAHKVRGASVALDLKAKARGTAHVFLWHGHVGAIPVYLTSCARRDDPFPDYGLSACAQTDGGSPAWSPDMSGHVVRDVRIDLHRGKNRVTIPLDRHDRRRIGRRSRALVSFENGRGEVQALDVPLRR